MQTEPTYRIQNWSEYNKALMQRRSITVWMDEKAIKNCFSSYHTCRSGGSATYSDKAILIMLILRGVHKSSLGNLQGFVQSLFTAMGLDLPVPSYSQISRRANSLHKRVGQLDRKKTWENMVGLSRKIVGGDGNV